MQKKKKKKPQKNAKNLTFQYVSSSAAVLQECFQILYPQITLGKELHRRRNICSKNDGGTSTFKKDCGTVRDLYKV